MKRLFALVLLLSSCAAAQWTTITASAIEDGAGRLLQIGTYCAQGVDANHNVINFTVSGGGSVISAPACVAVVNGAFASAFKLANVTTTNPAGIQYHVTITNASGGLVGEYWKYQPSGASTSWDTYSEAGAVTIPPTGGTVSGNLTVNGTLTTTGAITGDASNLQPLAARIYSGMAATTAFNAGMNANVANHQLAFLSDSTCYDYPDNTGLPTIPRWCYELVKNYIAPRNPAYTVKYRSVATVTVIATTTALNGSNLATYTVASTANLYSGEQVVISGSSHDATFNGTFYITVTSGTTFTVPVTHALITSAADAAAVVGVPLFPTMGSWYTVQTGTGSYELDVSNFSYPGMVPQFQMGPLSAQIISSNPELVVIAHGHNMGTSTEALNWKGNMFAFTESVAQQNPNASILIVAQNPEAPSCMYGNHTTDCATMPAKAAAFRWVAEKGGHGFIDVTQAFFDYSPGTTQWATDLINPYPTDGVHENLAGADYWASIVAPAFFYTRDAIVRSSHPTMLRGDSAQIIKNGNFSSWAGSCPDNWSTLGTATCSQDTTLGHYRSPNGYSVKVTTSAGTGAISQNLPLELVKGRWVTVTVSVYVGVGQANGISGYAGWVAITSDVGTNGQATVYTQDMQRGAGVLVTKVVSRYIDPTATTSAVNLYGDVGSGSGIASFDWVSVTIGQVPSLVPPITPSGFDPTATTIQFGPSVPSTDENVKINAGASSQPILRLQKGGIDRALFFVTNDTETGSDAGSNVALQVRSDAGSIIDSPLFIARAAGGFATWVRPNKFMQNANGSSVIYSTRFTDTAPTGNFMTFRNAADSTTLASLDVAGNLLANSFTTANGYQVSGAAAAGKILIGGGTYFGPSVPIYPNTVPSSGLYPKSNGTTGFANSTLAAAGVGGCTNQFVRTLNADAVPACNSVASTDLASTTGSGTVIPLATSPTFTTSVLSPAFSSTTASVAASGILRVASGDSALCFRNNANGADVCATKTGASSGTVPADTFDVSGFGSIKVNGIVAVNRLSATSAPSISSGFGTSPSVTIHNGSSAFRVNVGTGGSASSGVVALPTATTGWACNATDITTQSTSVFMTKQIATTSTTATFTNYNTAGAATAWVASDLLSISCWAY